ncbi:MFS transporter [Haliovirga abyssi]|uniref:Major facilitator superfamily (MFS) profile domain-containing protein n=1 Tax=Haliovirga abyssi TaxID=2996794 RepID=A0AAU9DF10_9FUSO|nr:MFS transporter [Haliovirga abyssi]BDU50987.1 hypothetical protein HLVA_15560 [Haliovirga abyssi]
MRKESFFDVFKKDRNFGILISSQIISQLGDAINWMANLAFVAVIAPGIGTSILMVWLMLPILLIGPFAGVIVDRFSRKRIMLISDITRALTIVLFLLYVLNFVKMENEVYKFQIQNNKFKLEKAEIKSLLSNDKVKTEKYDMKIEIKKINRSLVITGVPIKNINSDKVKIVITTGLEDYEKIYLKKNGNKYIGMVKFQESKYGKKKNKIVETNKKGTLSISVVEEKGFVNIIYIITFLISFITQFFIPAKSALLPHIVSKEHLVYANSFSASANRIVIVIGGALGGFLIGRFGILFAFFIDALTYLLSFSLVMIIKKDKVEKRAKHVKSNFIAELKEGIKYILNKDLTSFVFFRYVGIMSAGGVAYIFLVKYSNETLQMGVEGLGYLQTSLGIGIALGSVFLGFIGNRVKKVVFIKLGFIIVGLSVAGFAFIENIYMALGIGVLAGFGGAFIIILSETILQTVVPKNMQGRVFATLQTATNAAFALSAVLTGFLISGLNDKVVFTVLSLILLIIGITGEIYELIKKRRAIR